MIPAKRIAKISFIISILVFLNLIFLLIHIRTTKQIRFGDIVLSDKLNDGTQSYKRDWHNYVSMASALNRSGPGENGAPVLFEEYNKEIYDKYGFEALLSDVISLNRSVPDVRYEGCKNMTYLTNLPKSSIIIIFYNERLSVLLRTIYSILNRTPAELIEEIILVDDGSTWPDLHEPLDNFLKQYFPPEHSKIRLIRLPERKGLMVARMEGARNASKASEVYIFLDSHFEMMYNWLPPLLEPIALNPKACTIPSFDRINFTTLRYQFDGEQRGYFDWEFYYLLYALNDDELAHPAKNFRAYVMMGGALAIKAEYFWHLGGFDEGMTFWGGEQFELSFKIWMCGGEIINVPCSRMGHLFRDPFTKGNQNLYKDYSFMDRNIRRLIDVWFDYEHRQCVLNHRKNAGSVDPGDLTSRFALRDRLKCKSFRWMLDNIMPEIEKTFPLVEPTNFGYGVIRHYLNSEICIVFDEKDNEIILKKCDIDDELHKWTHSWRCELRGFYETCMENDMEKHHVNAYDCHLNGGNQKWYYDVKEHWIGNRQMCMMPNENETSVDLKICDPENENMKWIFDSYNETAINECNNISSESEAH